MDVIALANRIPSMIFGSKSDDDLSDRLNYRYTVALLLLFAVIITTRQFGSETIKCWVPAHFTSNYEQYASQICWISNTYYTDANEHIPKEEAERRKNEIKYYQWVSFLLLFQAFLFYLPRIFWRTASTRSGLDICDLVEAANNYKSADKFDNRKKYMEYLVTNIDQYVDDSRRYDDRRPLNKAKSFLYQIIPCAGRFLGNYIVALYFVVKIIYIINTGLQAAFLSSILGRSFFQFGVDFISKIFAGEGWVIESRYFPKVAFCDFYIREWGNPNKSHRYTVQCVLPINLFNQQIFIIIWFWYIIVFGYNLWDMGKWAIRCFPSKSSRWITQRIKLFNVNLEERFKDGNPSKKLENFLNKYLEPDGAFMIRVIGNNSSDFVATDLIHELWKKHYFKYGKQYQNEKQDENGNEIITQEYQTSFHHNLPLREYNQSNYDTDNNNNNNNNLHNRKLPRIQQNAEYFEQSKIINNDESTPFTTDIVNENNLLNRKREAGGNYNNTNNNLNNTNSTNV